ncbi:MAG: hypothetical protein LBL66_07500 [Clostridiales bacterium]|jgi:hypothetical protein|nr:hypothetical protein [Clostridiales bacterium]
MWQDEAFARLTRGGGVSDYVSGTEIAEEGGCVLEFWDGNGFYRAYNFTIDKTAQEGTLSGVGNGGITNKEVALTFMKEGVAAQVYKDGVLAGEYGSGTGITADGGYRIVLADRAGNTSEYTFAVDTAKPEAQLAGVGNGGRTGGSVTLKNPTEPCVVTAYRDGAEFKYTFGDTLAQEGVYRIALTDAVGNVTEYGFEIVYAVNAAGTAVILILTVLAVGGIAAVYIKRKRKAFKPKKKAA